MVNNATLQKVSFPLYHLSMTNGLKKLTPQIPFDANYPEDAVTPRCCFSPSIDGCLKALGDWKKEYFVYVPLINENVEVYFPNIKEVYDVDFTEEVWIIKSIPVVCIGRIFAKAICFKELYSFANTPFMIGYYNYRWLDAYFKYDNDFKMYYTNCNFKRKEKRKKFLFP